MLVGDEMVQGKGHQEGEPIRHHTGVREQSEKSREGNLCGQEKHREIIIVGEAKENKRIMVKSSKY